MGGGIQRGATNVMGYTTKNHEFHLYFSNIIPFFPVSASGIRACFLFFRRRVSRARRGEGRGGADIVQSVLGIKSATSSDLYTNSC